MLATTWEKERATKAMTGKKMPKILPMMSWAAVACQTPRHTIQLQKSARRISCPKGALVLLAAMVMGYRAPAALVNRKVCASRHSSHWLCHGALLGFVLPIRAL